VAPWSSQNRTKLISRGPWLSSLNPSPPHGQVLLGPGPQRAHWPAPGHWRASGRSAFWSTLA
jgi:hypothetical protein